MSEHNSIKDLNQSKIQFPKIDSSNAKVNSNKKTLASEGKKKEVVLD